MTKISAYVSDRQKNRKKRRRFFFGVIVVFGLYLIFAGVVWVVLRSPLFRVGEITVKGNNVVQSEDIISLLESSALRDHSFVRSLMGFRNMLMWPTDISPGDMALLPQLSSVTTEKDYFSKTLTITVAERTPFGIWCFEQGGQCYWFDDTGTIFAKAFRAEGNVIFTVTDESQPPRGLNLKILPDAFTPNLISILNVLRASGLTVEGITLKDLSLEEISVTTQNGPQFYFSLRFPAGNYLPVIKNMMTRTGFSKIGYIDCRTENRVYYK